MKKWYEIRKICLEWENIKANRFEVRYNLLRDAKKYLKTINERLLNKQEILFNYWNAFIWPFREYKNIKKNNISLKWKELRIILDDKREILI